LTIHLDELVNSVAEIENWLDFREIKQEADAIGIGQFIDVLIQKNISDLNENQLKNIFHKKLFQLWADKIELENPLLRKFSGQEQEINIARFIENDLKKIKENQLGISKSIALNWIEYASNPFNKEPLQVLNHEINKKKKHKPIRVLIKEIPDLLMTLKPCWMMSPLSVSQLIESGGKIAFDLVIFDEASQIRTEDAICAIYRGSQLILAGDSNQLPPTNFFNYINDDDDYENNNFESVLDECNVFLDSHTLSWHYRSRHEDLIKFSNKYIYDNQLVTFPSPISKSENLGLQFEYIEKGYYEKGSRFNRKEAQRVAEAIVEHYSKYPEFSLGVIAFSEAQQFAIERELAKLIRNNENINQYLDEDKKDHLFVKNLENVQGDERDVIYFSIGYAKDKQGNLSHNFGPLNREGGHRRLNVAITRARNKIKVFSSIYSGEIDLNRTSAQGAILLKKYLAFVENPSLDSSSSEQIQDKLSEVDHLFINQADSFLIEKSIQKALQDKGFETCLLLGASSFKIDVAVKSKDNPEIFALAIETDGIDYLKANTVRDRDRLRPNVLKSLGWKIHQVWARDWIRNQEQELEKILQSINESI
ncbi:MAG: AAA domain-containing protein, partial [Candidatus Caenarcaniphilales bacterium]|nr:AAA domain-containing protein [Candidatus Caenarcaniphilales bacterium]